jgi:hypothetical protein
MDAQYPSAGGGEASEFRLDDLFNAREALQKHPKKDTTRFFCGRTLLHSMSPLMTPTETSSLINV